MEIKELEIRPTSRPQLADMIRWWRKNKNGHFNKNLYMRICEIKAKIR